MCRPQRYPRLSISSRPRNLGNNHAVHFRMECMTRAQFSLRTLLLIVFLVPFAIFAVRAFPGEDDAWDYVRPSWVEMSIFALLVLVTVLLSRARRPWLAGCHWYLVALAGVLLSLDAVRATVRLLETLAISSSGGRFSGTFYPHGFDLILATRVILPLLPTLVWIDFKLQRGDYPDLTARRFLVAAAVAEFNALLFCWYIAWLLFLPLDDSGQVIWIPFAW